MDTLNSNSKDDMTKVTLDDEYTINVPNHDLITLTWEGVNAYVPETKKGLFSKKASEKQHILKNVCGIAKPGEVLAIMGASGAGKTTLLNALTYRNRGSLQIIGNVKINGDSVYDPQQLASISGYVQQSDLFIGTLKVKEHLAFQAMLRMGKDFSKQEKLDRVEQVLNELNLKKCENTLIGAPNLGVKGISGGEMRRLAFASEIILNPPILFADEATSGLDSFMAKSVVDCMKELAKKGKTVVCTIHQPSSELFEMFDKLCLMAEGRLAFYGSITHAFDFFKDQGYECPLNYNPADFYIKTLAIQRSNKEECKLKVNEICDGYSKSGLMSQMLGDIKSASSNAITNKDRVNDQTYNKSTYKSGFFTQLRWLVWRNFLGSWRNPMETNVMAIQSVTIALMFGLIYLNLEVEQKNVLNINSVLFLLITNTSFSNLFGVINTFPAEIPIFLREHQNGLYRVFTYYFSKLFIELPKYIIFPFIFVSIVYWMAALNSQIDRFLLCCAVLILVAQCAVSFGSFISSAAPSTNVALAMAGPVLVPLMIFSGFFLNNSTVPVYFLWMKYLSWLNYANEILVVNQWDGIDKIPCPPNSTLCYNSGQVVISSLDMKKENLPLDFILLGVIILVLRILSFLILLLKSYLRK